MISYAQNAEDVVLARALPGDIGFYVDVGAADPDDASVTRHFYELGWCGINVEPRAEAVEQLRRRRPRDVNLHAAAGAADGTVTLHRVTADPDLSTTVAGQLQLLPGGHEETTTATVPVRTLNGILEEYARAAVDFLKIDAEGSEHAVLEGLDLGRWHPRVVVVESVLPWSSIRNDGEWRHHLERAGYREALFDGVNLFFARASEPELLARLGAPASALDGYIRAFEATQAAEIDALRQRVEALQRTLELRSGRRAGASPVALARPVRAPIPPAHLSGHRPPGDGRPPPPRPARVAVVGRPFGSWLGRVVAGALDATHVEVAHPGDVTWVGLPDRVVVGVPWRRSRLLEQTLREHQFVAVCAAPAGSAPDWWATPSTCRVVADDLAADPVGVVAGVLDECGLAAVRPVAEVVDAAGPPA